MKVEKFEIRDLNHDNKVYNLSVNYAAEELNKKESIKYESFYVVYELDNRVYKFVTSGKFITNGKEEEFNLCIEEFDDFNYDTSLLQKIFFNSRNTINALIKSYFNGDIKIKEEVAILDIIKSEEDSNYMDNEFNDTFINDNVDKILLKEEDLLDIYEKAEPLIILDKKPSGRPSKKVKKDIK